MTEDRQRIIRRIVRIQTLAECGEDGERQAAVASVERLMKKYDISEAEIFTERRETAWFSFKTSLERQLLLQIIASVTGEASAFERVSPEGTQDEQAVGTVRTGAEREEIEESFMFYRGVMERELERFMTAFVQKHKLFVSSEKRDGKSGRTINFVEVVKINAFMAGMDDYPRRNAHSY